MWYAVQRLACAQLKYQLLFVLTEWSALLWDVGELDVEVDPITILALGGSDGTLDTEWVHWENGGVSWASWLVGDGGGVAALL